MSDYIFGLLVGRANPINIKKLVWTPPNSGLQPSACAPLCCTSAAKIITKNLFTTKKLEAINYVIIPKTLCIQLDKTRKGPQQYYKNSCFRELFYNNCGQHGKRGELFHLQLELFCFQLSFIAYSPLRPLLDALAHCKQKSSNCKQKN